MLPFWYFSGFSSHFPVHWKVRIPDSSVGKESSCNAGDPSSIPGSGRSPRKGIGYPFQYFWASLVAQMVKNLPAMWETWIWSLGWEDLLEEGMATHLPGEFHGQRSLVGYSPWGRRVGHNWETKHNRARRVCWLYLPVALCIAGAGFSPPQWYTFHGTSPWAKRYAYQ